MNKNEINIYEDIIHIKNYIKINDINNKCILIELNNKKIKICGKNLMINKLDKYELSIIGVCTNIELIYE